jgi:hypothetical protein
MGAATTAASAEKSAAPALSPEADGVGEGVGEGEGEGDPVGTIAERGAGPRSTVPTTEGAPVLASSTTRQGDDGEAGRRAEAAQAEPPASVKAEARRSGTPAEIRTTRLRRLSNPRGEGQGLPLQVLR